MLGLLMMTMDEMKNAIARASEMNIEVCRYFCFAVLFGPNFVISLFMWRMMKRVCRCLCVCQYDARDV